MQDIYALKIFTWLEKNIIDIIMKNSPSEIFHPGEIIIIEWTPSNGKGYIIQSWEVKVEIGWKHITTLWAGEIFWEIALLNEDLRTATITAISQTEVIVLNQENLIEMINNGNESINKDIMDRLEYNLIHNC